MNNLVYFSVNLQTRYALLPFQNNVSFAEKYQSFEFLQLQKSITFVL